MLRSDVNYQFYLRRANFGNLTLFKYIAWIREIGTRIDIQFTSVHFLVVSLAHHLKKQRPKFKEIAATEPCIRCGLYKLVRCWLNASRLIKSTRPRKDDSFCAADKINHHRRDSYYIAHITHHMKRSDLIIIRQLWRDLICLHFYIPNVFRF